MSIYSHHKYGLFCIFQFSMKHDKYLKPTIIQTFYRAKDKALMVLRVVFNVQSHYIMTSDNFSKVFAMEPSQSQNNCARMLHKNSIHNNRDELILYHI
jgi:hypothetical protein